MTALYSEREIQMMKLEKDEATHHHEFIDSNTKELLDLTQEAEGYPMDIQSDEAKEIIRRLRAVEDTRDIYNYSPQSTSYEPTITVYETDRGTLNLYQVDRNGDGVPGNGKRMTKRYGILVNEDETQFISFNGKRESEKSTDVFSYFRDLKDSFVKMASNLLKN